MEAGKFSFYWHPQFPPRCSAQSAAIAQWGSIASRGLVSHAHPSRRHTSQLLKAGFQSG